MNVEILLLLIAGAFSAAFTFMLQVKWKLGAVRASALVGVLIGGFVLLLPNVLSTYLTHNLPLVCFGASFIGMVSSKVVHNYWFMGLSGGIFTVLFLNSSTHINNFGGGLGAAACIALLISLALLQVWKSKRLKKYFKLDKWMK